MIVLLFLPVLFREQIYQEIKSLLRHSGIISFRGNTKIVWLNPFSSFIVKTSKIKEELIVTGMERSDYPIYVPDRYKIVKNLYHWHFSIQVSNATSEWLLQPIVRATKSNISDPVKWNCITYWFLQKGKSILKALKPNVCSNYYRISWV